MGSLIHKISHVSMKTRYLLAGCNGAGKTTAAFTLLPGLLDCCDFVNADEIARGLSCPSRPNEPPGGPADADAAARVAGCKGAS